MCQGGVPYYFGDIKIYRDIIFAKKEAYSIKERDE